jgi:hypothetical protein
MKEFILGFENCAAAEQAREHKRHELCYQKTHQQMIPDPVCRLVTSLPATATLSASTMP